jgi:hypothetical protein
MLLLIKMVRFKFKAVETTAAWVNFMKEGESNPPHIHHNCHLSSVLVLDVPDKIKKNKRHGRVPAMVLRR